MDVGKRIYRPHLALRAGVAIGLTLWLWITTLALGLQLDAGSVFQALGLVAFFTLLAGHWLPMAIEVDDAGVTQHTWWGDRRVRFEDIRGIDVMPVAGVTSYGVRSRRMVIAFTSFIAGHRELVATIAQRAQVPV